MGFRDDVILRMIRQLVEALLNLRRVRRERGDAVALDEVDDVIQRYAGVPAALVAAATPDTLLALLSPAGQLDVERALGLARILDEQAALHAAVGDAPAAAAVADKARALDAAARAVDPDGAARFDEAQPPMS